MNLMTIQQYKNEIILFISILFALFGFIYKSSANSYVIENKAKIQQQISEINKISSLKDQWAGKNIANKVKVLKNVVASNKINSFNKKSKKLVAKYSNLTAAELNKLSNKLINIPVQIVKLNINQIARNQYTMEFTCKW